MDVDYNIFEVYIDYELGLSSYDIKGFFSKDEAIKFKLKQNYSKYKLLMLEKESKEAEKIKESIIEVDKTKYKISLNRFIIVVMLSNLLTGYALFYYKEYIVSLLILIGLYR